jgi:hypothetical protein
MNRAIPMAAGILAFVAGAYQGWSIPRLLHTASTYAETLRGLEDYTTSFHAFVMWLTTEAVASAIAALALILGGAMVLAGMPLGRGFVIVGCAIAVIHSCVGWMIATSMLHWFAEIGADDYGLLWFNIPNRSAIVVLSIVVPVVTVILAMLPATRRWCQETPEAGATETAAAQGDPAPTAKPTSEIADRHPPPG